MEEDHLQEARAALGGAFYCNLFTFNLSKLLNNNINNLLYSHILQHVPVAIHTLLVR